MTQRLNPKRVFPVIARFLANKQREPAKQKASPELIAKAQAMMQHLVDQAFRDAKLDQEKEDDWKFLAVSLIFAVYAGKAIGHPPVWTGPALLKLAGDAEKLKTSMNKNDKECCSHLVRQPPYSEMRGRRGERITAATLLRRLPEARAVKVLAEAKG